MMKTLIYYELSQKDKTGVEGETYMTKIDIISGFLGSGKTTLIKKLLDEKLVKEKVVIIENEFGKIGIDGSVLKEPGVEVFEMNAGCICCSLVGPFCSALGKVVDRFKPDRIIIEPTGVGKLSDVLSSCYELSKDQNLKLNMVAVVVDVMKYDMYMENVSDFFADQIINAKIVILSRTQKADVEQITSVMKNIKKINKDASIITTPWDQLDAKKIYSLAQEPIQPLLEYPTDPKEPCNHNHNHDHDHDASHKVFETWETETVLLFTECEIQKSLEALSQKRYGTVYRAKGIVQTEVGKWIKFDFVPGEIEITQIEPDLTGRLCVIGSNLDKELIADLFIESKT